MRALLDVNVLIALLDADHSLHARATTVVRKITHEPGWASCPITQNGCVRIMSHPGYPNALPVACGHRSPRGGRAPSDFHEFWPDDISLLDAQVARCRADPWTTSDHGCLSIGALGPARWKVCHFRFLDLARCRHRCRQGSPTRPLTDALDEILYVLFSFTLPTGRPGFRFAQRRSTRADLPKISTHRRSTSQQRDADSGACRAQLLIEGGQR